MDQDDQSANDTASAAHGKRGRTELDCPLSPDSEEGEGQKRMPVPLARQGASTPGDRDDNHAGTDAGEEQALYDSFIGPLPHLRGRLWRPPMTCRL